MGRGIETFRSGAILCAFIAATALLVAGCEDTPLRAHILRVTDFEGELFVGGPGAADTNRGVSGEALATIQAGIEAAQWYIDQGIADKVAIYVAEGLHEVSYVDGTHIELVEGISLYGGCSPLFDVQNPALHETVIQDTSTTVRLDANANRAVDGGIGLTNDTVFDGFTVIGGTAPRSTGIYILESSPTIRNCNISGGHPEHETITWIWAYGIYCETSAADLSDNTITGSENPAAVFTTGIFVKDGDDLMEISHNQVSAGVASDTCIGIELTAGSETSVDRNTITVTTGEGAVGIQVLESTPELYGNTIAVGGATCAEVIGIEFDRSSAWTNANTIVCGEATNWTVGIRVGTASTPYILGNSIFAGNAANNARGISVSAGSEYWVQVAGNYVHGGNNAAWATGIEFISAGGAIRNNVIYGGGPGCIGSVGIRVSAATPQIENNTVCGGSATDFSCAIMSDGSSPPIINNILFTDGVGYQGAIATTTQLQDGVMNNLFYDTGALVYYDDDFGGPISDIGALESYLGAEAIDNLDGDPQFVDIDGPDDDIATLDDNDWRLSGTTPLTITDGGYDLSAYLDEDIESTERTDPLSIGAYEYD